MKLRFDLLGVVLVANLLLGQFAFGQEKTRTLEHQKYKYKNEPIAIVGRKVDDKSFDSQVSADSNWLRTLSLSIKNISPMNITFIEIHLVIDDPSKLPLQESLTIRFTGWPSAKDNTEFVESGGRRTILRPGDVTTLSVKEQLSSGISAYLKRLENSDFDTVSVDIRYVHFDDGTGWAVGHETREDPKRPGSFIPIRGS